MSSHTISLVRHAAKALYDKKGQNILAIDVRGTSSVTDFFLIASGSVERHVQAMAGHAEEVLRADGERPLHVEGVASGDWVVLDYGFCIIHLFETEMRDKYQIEKLWHEGKIIDLHLEDTHAE